MIVPIGQWDGDVMCSRLWGGAEKSGLEAEGLFEYLCVSSLSPRSLESSGEDRT